MNKNNYIVAIEIGSSKIKGAVGQVDPSGVLTVKGIEEEHQHPNYVRYGCVQNVAEVAAQLKRVIAKLNNRIAPAKISAAYVGIGGRSLRSTPAHLNIALADDTEITREIVESLLSRARVAGAETALLDVEPMQFQVNGKTQGMDPVGMLARELSADVNLVSCRKQIQKNLDIAVKDKTGIDINGYVVRPMALADLVLNSEQKMVGTMLVDAGAETTTVAIYKEGALIYLATLPLGSRHITRDLQAAMSTLEDKAEETKRVQGNANPDTERRSGITDEVDTSKINEVISTRAAEIIANINAQIEYAGMTSGDIREIVIVGGGSMLKGFGELLSQTTGKGVRRGTLSPEVRISGTKISTGEDLDVISLLYRISRNDAALRPCTVEPEPAAQQPVQQTAPEPEPEEEEEEIDDLPKTSWISRLMNKIKNGPAMDTFDEDEDDKL